MKMRKKMIVIRKGNFGFRKQGMMCCSFKVFSRN